MGHRLRIVVEGITGSGKTTMVNVLARFLQENGVPTRIDPYEVQEVPPAEELGKYDHYDEVVVDARNMVMLEDAGRDPNDRSVNVRLNVAAAREVRRTSGEEAMRLTLESKVLAIVNREIDRPDHECAVAGCHREATQFRRSVPSDAKMPAFDTAYCRAHGPSSEAMKGR